MANKREKAKQYACDFETTVYEGQENTEVWSAAIVEVGKDNKDDVTVLHSIDDFFKYVYDLKKSCILYFHNLKFDGSFILDWLLHNKKYKQGYIGTTLEGSFKEKTNLAGGEFIYSISNMGQWYGITIKHGNQFIEIRDSLKLIPVSLKQMGKAFNTKHRKLEMEYEGYRYAGCEITEEELDYIKNDVLVLSEALDYMFKAGHDKMTIGSCCMSEFKSYYDKQEFKTMYPDLTEYELKEEEFGCTNADEYIRKSYKGGWCYAKDDKTNKIIKNGCTADVNSLYPSMMSLESGNIYPVGKPTFWKGEIPEEALKPNRYYFVKFKCRFKIKKNHLPWLQIKGNVLYEGNECLTTSDIKDFKTGKYSRYYIDVDGKKTDSVVTLTMTMTDFQLFKDHYDIYDLQMISGCWFYAKSGIFEHYIAKYRKMKIEAKDPGKRQIAKLFLNNLYGKFATSPDDSFKVAFLDEEGLVHFATIRSKTKPVIYIPIGSAITSYARNFTIRAAQQNYDTFCYADTDSIHCACSPKEVKGIKVHPKNFCCWKVETTWDYALFVRQKTYAEHVIEEDEEPIEKPYLNLKCAGMPETCKQLFIKSIEQDYDDEFLSKCDENEIKFLKEKHELSDFKEGLTVPGKLMPKRIKGGILLVKSDYTLRF